MNDRSTLDRMNALARTINDTIWGTFNEEELDAWFGTINDGAHVVSDDHLGICIHLRASGQEIHLNADDSWTLRDEGTGENATTNHDESVIVLTIMRDVLDILLAERPMLLDE